ncbi:hypothetical protein KIW84_020553 [Lathyrus oleraceus]|uniref:Retrovirus-related Pol polyprotein from transposon TNT 1-94-like beta-barrel domain-containing protein n=1 Tax=Pisum sativum TaxID=3888 RepID=A0A9D5B495_PEA|nr:hypothetical protein KIW84_020553 [Pisum sativum]
MMGKTPQNFESKGSTLATRNLDEGRRSNKVPWCDHCKCKWHTRETCWKLKGKPPNWKNKNGRAFQASNFDQAQQPPQSQFPLTTEQLDRLYKLLESLSPSYSIETKGNSAFLSVSPSHTWIVDSGAYDHMTDESTLFSSYSPCAGNQKIKIAYGSFSAIAGKGSIVLSPMLTLKNVLHDLNSGKMIGNAKESGGLYYLDIGSASQLPSITISSCFESFSVLNNKDDNIMMDSYLDEPLAQKFNILNNLLNTLTSKVKYFPHHNYWNIPDSIKDIFPCLQTKEILWHPPPIGWLKCNIDGVARGTSITRACVGIFRNDRCIFVGRFYGYLGAGSTLMAGIYAAIVASGNAKARNW